MAVKHPQNDSGVITRFAPSPSGYLHLGHAYSAWMNFERARAAGGRFLLRIEDIDTARCRPEFEAAIYEDLAWLGLSWDAQVLQQSARLAFYEARLAELHERGLVYRCFRSRQDIANAMNAPHGATAQAFRGEALSPRDERENLAGSRPFAWRLSLEAAEAVLGPEFATLTYWQETPDGGLAQHPAEPWRLGDVVLGRKDIGTSYHLASVLDDAETGVTHVIRGEDLREAAGLHALLHALFGLQPPIYRHHRLLLDDQGHRLSKRNKSATLRAMREAGATPEDVRAQLQAVSDMC
jgi:glutamyl-Q tRNA(Asp) synthetase